MAKGDQTQNPQDQVNQPTRKPQEGSQRQPSGNEITDLSNDDDADPHLGEQQPNSGVAQATLEDKVELQAQNRSGVNPNTLEIGDTILTRMTKANKFGPNGSKYVLKPGEEEGIHDYKMRLEFVTKVENPNRPNDFFAQLNASDERFAQNGLAMEWLTVEAVDAARVFAAQAGMSPKAFLEVFRNLELTTGKHRQVQDAGDDFHELNIWGPKFNGIPLNVQVEETTRKPNAQAQAKINPTTGDTITYEGLPVYRDNKIVNGIPQHKFLPSDSLTGGANTRTEMIERQKQAYRDSQRDSHAEENAKVLTPRNVDALQNL
jgi:hypothetical protein